MDRYCAGKGHEIITLIAYFESRFDKNGCLRLQWFHGPKLRNEQTGRLEYSVTMHR